MNRKEVRELCEVTIGVHGSGKTQRINKTLLNKLINEIQLEYFRKTRILKAYMQSTIEQGQFEYTLPSDCLRVDRVTVENVLYTQRGFPSAVDSYELGFDADQVVDA